MAGNGLGEQDLERLTAWMDGELGEDEAREVTRRVESDRRWRQAYEEFAALYRILDMATPPVPPPGMTERIVRTARRRRLWVRAGRVAGAVAVAAAVLVAVWLGPGQRGAPVAPADTAAAPGEKLIAKALEGVPETDRFLVEHLDVFRNYDRAVAYEEVRSIADDETLTVLAALEGPGRS